jgi:hypothetical protein
MKGDQDGWSEPNVKTSLILQGFRCEAIAHKCLWIANG